MIKEIIISTTENYYDSDEIFTDFYKCPNCGDTHIIKGFKYCSGCGGKLIWQ